jgi:hypothetical protein
MLSQKTNVSFVLLGSYQSSRRSEAGYQSAKNLVNGSWFVKNLEGLDGVFFTLLPS